MALNDLMSDFPPAKEKLVSLANWRTAPYSQWAFRNIRRLLPTAHIDRAETSVPFEYDLADIGQVEFTGKDGSPTTIAAALTESNTDAFVVLQRGKIVSEWYADGMDARTQHIVFSVSKSICGSLGGILADKRKLNPDDLVTKYIPELTDSVYGGDCTVRHLLDMAVGISFTEDYLDPAGDVARYRLAMGWDAAPVGTEPSDLRTFLAQQKSDGSAHGHKFHYVSTNTDVLGWVYERACDMPLAEIISEYLWKPMGAQDDAYITVDRFDAMRAAGGICTTPRDLARFGEMMRRRGVSNGRQVVPGSWVDDINQEGDPEAWKRGDFNTLFPNASYRSKWYRVDRERQVLMAYGIHGQIIYINPDAEMVAIRMASEPIPVEEASAHAWRRALDALAEALT